MKEENQEIHYCENPGCNKIAIKKYKSGWCCSSKCAMSLGSKHGNHSHPKGHHKCNQCELEFLTQKELQQHKINVHYGNETYTCICGKAFHSKRSLGSHKQQCEEVRKANGKSTNYVCTGCQRKFKTRASLQAHLSHCEKYIAPEAQKTKYLVGNVYRCECGREFNNRQSLNAHFAYCLKHKHELGLPEIIAESKLRSGNKCSFSKEFLGEERFNELHKNAGKSLHQNILDGKTTPNWLGRKHSDATKEKIRKSTANYIINIVGSRPRYNKSSISILEVIAKEHGWNIQHAENGGEFYTGIGYFVDAYDKEKNIVLEFDEAAHYIDAENNVLREKDIIRQKNIIEHLHCEYWRYNSVTGLLWKVEI